MKKDTLRYNCIECGTPMEKKVGKFGDFYACPNWQPKDSPCKGHIFYPPNTWKVASGSEKDKTYRIKNLNGKLYCECPAGVMQKVECRHKKKIKKFYHLEKKDPQMEKMFNDMKSKGFFKNYETYDKWEDKGRM